MELRERLAIPYVLEAETISDGHGGWKRRLSYPDLPGCVVEGVDMYSLMEEVESKRVEMLVMDATLSDADAARQPLLEGPYSLAAEPLERLLESKGFGSAKRTS